MDFHQKLQELRKQKGLTQEELAKDLFVSRTAISKWESGRGYPNIESLKAVAALFEVTVDELLSSDELLTVAEHDHKQTAMRFLDVVFGVLDIGTLMFWLLPLFGQRGEGVIRSVPLFALTSVSSWLMVAYSAVISITMIWGVLMLALQNVQNKWWLSYKSLVSVVLNVMGVLLFIVSLQPYAAALLFLFVMIKVFVMMKQR